MEGVLPQAVATCDIPKDLIRLFHCKNKYLVGTKKCVVHSVKKWRFLGPGMLYFSIGHITLFLICIKLNGVCLGQPDNCTFPFTQTITDFNVNGILHSLLFKNGTCLIGHMCTNSESFKTTVLQSTYNNLN